MILDEETARDLARLVKLHQGIDSGEEHLTGTAGDYGSLERSLIASLSPLVEQMTLAGLFYVALDREHGDVSDFMHPAHGFVGFYCNQLVVNDGFFLMPSKPYHSRLRSHDYQKIGAVTAAVKRFAAVQQLYQDVGVQECETDTVFQGLLYATLKGHTVTVPRQPDAWMLNASDKAAEAARTLARTTQEGVDAILSVPREDFPVLETVLAPLLTRVWERPVSANGCALPGISGEAVPG